jgi:hypothetical protein
LALKKETSSHREILMIVFHKQPLFHPKVSTVAPRKLTAFAPEYSRFALKKQHSSPKEESIVELKKPPPFTPEDFRGDPRKQPQWPT